MLSAEGKRHFTTGIIVRVSLTGQAMSQKASFLLKQELKQYTLTLNHKCFYRVSPIVAKPYWEIGEEINRKQREEGWGKSVVEILAKELQK